MTIFKIGSKVTIGKDISAKVTEVLIKEGAIMYRCSWWNGRERKDDWLHGFEVISNNSEYVKIGFINDKNN